MDGWTGRPTYRETDVQPIKMRGLTVFLLKTIKQRVPLLSNALFLVDYFLLLFSAISLGNPLRFVGLFPSNMYNTSLLKGDGQSDKWFYPVGVSSNLFAPQMPGPAEVKTSEVILLARKFC
jgi:hypothetical protein